MSSITKNSSFSSQIKNYGIKKLIFSWDFAVLIAVFALLMIDYFQNLGVTSSINDNYITLIVTIASAIFSVLVTALAIILSFSSSSFVKFLREKKMFDKIIFIFWFTSIIFLSVLMLVFIKQLLIINIPILSALFSSLILSLFIYGMIETYYVIGSLMRFAHFLGQYEEKIN